MSIFLCLPRRDPSTTMTLHRFPESSLNLTIMVAKTCEETPRDSISFDPVLARTWSPSWECRGSTLRLGQASCRNHEQPPSSSLLLLFVVRLYVLCYGFGKNCDIQLEHGMYCVVYRFYRAGLGEEGFRGRSLRLSDSRSQWGQLGRRCMPSGRGERVCLRTLRRVQC